MILERVDEKATPERVQEIMTSADLNSDGVIDLPEFLAMVYASDKSGRETSFSNIYRKVKSKIVKGLGDAQHSYTEEECVSFSGHINHVLGGDENCARYLPLDPYSDDLFRKLEDGVLLCKLINDSKPNSIDERVLCTKEGMNVFQKKQNLNLAINSATAIGCQVVNVQPEAIMEGRPHIILGLVWQVVKIGLLSDINLQSCPELVRLLLEGESLEDFLRLPPEHILIRWVNYHLARAGSDRRIANFGADIRDSVAYTILLGQISHGICSQHPLDVEDQSDRAEAMLVEAEKIDCRKFVSARDVVRGNTKLNLAFVAYLFNNHPALEEISEEEKKRFADALNEILELDESGTREERAFRFWMQNLGLEVTNLFDDVADGILLAKAFDIMRPGIVDWKKVNMNPKMIFHKGENCNYAISLGRQLKFNLVNIDGSDITQKNKKLILGLVWQMFRYNLVEMIKSLSQDGKDISDDQIVAWANQIVKKSGKSSSISSHRDPQISNGIFLLDLCDSVMPGIVNFDMVTPGETEEEKALNAKYAISVARALGSTLFCLWEDLTEGNDKMILSFLASLMLEDRKIAARENEASSSS